jgi:hypothetical protein
MASVERGYHNNRPLHHHELARLPEYDPSTTLSDIFVSDYAKLIEMTEKEVADIHRHRHILATNCPYKDKGFSEETFSKIIGLCKVVKLHGELAFCESHIYLILWTDMAKKNTDNPYVLLTVEDHVKEAHRPGGGRYNCLSMPVGFDLEPLPQTGLIFLY